MAFHIHENKETNSLYWKLVAKNGEVLCHSEMYDSKQAVKKGIESTRRNAFLGKVIDHTLPESRH